MNTPLHDITVVEFAAIGPAPFVGMMLAGMGARVIRVERPRPSALEQMVPREYDIPARDRELVTLDLKSPEGVEEALGLVAEADILLEGLRPGVMERLGLGPEACHALNPALVYGRVTGWGQEGPLARTSGHDINYLSLTGALDAIGVAGGPPTIPLNLVADYGGGGMLLAFGVVSALHQARSTGRGSVVDAAMIDGVAQLMAGIQGMKQAGLWPESRGQNLLDGGAPFYCVYEASCGGYVAVGAIEPQFYAVMLDILDLDPADLPHQLDQSRWPELRARLAERFKSQPRDHWADRFFGTEACVTPVLAIGEVSRHPHHEARTTYEERAGTLQPRPAPRIRSHGLNLGPSSGER